MKGSPKVIDYLNFLLGGELAARDQYFIHAQMYHEAVGTLVLYSFIRSFVPPKSLRTSKLY